MYYLCEASDELDSDCGFSVPSTSSNSSTISTVSSSQRMTRRGQFIGPHSQVIELELLDVISILLPSD